MGHGKIAEDLRAKGKKVVGGTEYTDRLEDDRTFGQEELKKAGNCCFPVIDLLADGSFIACYPLNDLVKIKLDDQFDARALIARFEEALRPYTNAGIYPYCTVCIQFKKLCNGGCISYRIQRFSDHLKYIE